MSRRAFHFERSILLCLLLGFASAAGTLWYVSQQIYEGVMRVPATGKDPLGRQGGEVRRRFARVRGIPSPVPTRRLTGTHVSPIGRNVG